MNSSPSILFIDIENSPIKGFSWSVYNTNLLKIIEPSKIISVAWKYLGDKNTTVKCLADYVNYEPGQLNDKELVSETWKLLDEADIVCAHNGTTFDIKKLNARFVYYKLLMPSAFEVVDTLKIAKKHFRFDQNSLDSLGEYLGEGRKINTGGFDLWDQCINGDAESWLLMKKYNARDVDLLEKIYLRFRPYFEHPNLNLYSKTSDVACPSCMSTDLHKRGTAKTKTGIKQRFQCNSCGAWSSGGLETQKGVLR